MGEGVIVTVHSITVCGLIFVWMCPLLLTQDENMMNFIKGGIKVRNSYLIYKSVHFRMNDEMIGMGKKAR